MKEKWKIIKSEWFNNEKMVKKYFVSNFGIVKNEEGKIMKTVIDKDGYERVRLSFVRQNKKDKRKLIPIARLVCLAFNYRDDFKDMTVHHIDHNKTNNKVDNLRWETKENNSKLNKIDKTHAYGEKNYGAKLTQREILDIYNRIFLGEDIKRVYSDYQKIITRDHFRKIITGKAWNISYRKFLRDKNVQRLVNP